MGNKRTLRNAKKMAPDSSRANLVEQMLHYYGHDFRIDSMDKVSDMSQYLEERAMGGINHTGPSPHTTRT